jgi:hypothetical protein
MNREDIIRLVRQAANEEMEIAVLSITELEKYTALVEKQRTWVGLTSEDFAGCSTHEAQWARYWEKLLKERNT